MITPKQILQRLLIALAQVKSDNRFGNLLNEIRQTTNSLYRAKKLLKKHTTIQGTQYSYKTE